MKKTAPTPGSIPVAILATLAGLGLLAAGCSTPSTHVGAFARAAGDASENIQNALRAVDQTTVERKLSDIALSTNRPVITAETFQGLFDEEKQLRPRLAVLEQLEGYANALGNLATADFRKDIDTASKDLYGALAGLAATYTKATGKPLQVDEADLMIVATSIDAIGTVIVEARRQQAIRQIVVKFDPAIQKVSAYLARELPDLYSDLVKANLEATSDDLTSAYKREAPSLNYQERMTALRRLGQARQAPRAAPALFAAAGRAAAEIGAAHAALQAAATRRKLTSRELVAHIKTLVATAESIKEFYEKLKAKG